MKRMKKIIRTAVLALIICTMLAVTVFAADSGTVWLSTAESSDGNSTAALVVTDTTVTDGVITLTYDSSVLAYEGVEINEAYVAMYSVNAETAGTVRISWVAPGAYETDGTGAALFQVNFSGTGSAPELSGQVYDAQENLIVIGTVNTIELQKAILEAEALDAGNYTADSFAVLESALSEARAVLADPTATQAEIDAAAATLRSAMDALELKPAETEPAETEPAGTEPAGTEPAETTEPAGTTEPTEDTEVPAPTDGARVDFAALRKSILKAEALDAGNYTADSFAVVEIALDGARAVLADKNSTQEQVDAAAAELNAAIAALVLADSDQPGTGDSSNPGLMIGLMLVSAIGIAVLILMKKHPHKGRYAK